MFHGALPVFDRNKSLYAQLYQWIKQLIADGALPPGYRLPPTREAAGKLGIARQVVITAYEELEADGAVTGQRGKVTFVAGSGN